MSGYLLAVLAGYLLGSLPTGYWMGLAKGVDIRKVGSGNIGATNVFRILGKPAGVFVLLGDAAKGVLACFAGPWAAAWISTASADPELASRHALAGGLAAILGHNYTFWLNFKGGKGVTTTAGVLGALITPVFLAALGIFAVVFALSRFVSLASICAAAALPLLAWLMNRGWGWTAILAAIGGLAIYKHRGNIQRLLNGTENRFGSKKTEAATPEVRP